MEKAIIMFIISMIFLLISLEFILSLKKEKIKEKDYPKTTATIEYELLEDGGTVMYYVTFFDGGKKVTAQTVHYSSVERELYSGDKVNISYFYTRLGDAMAIINEEGMVRCGESVPQFCKVMGAIGISLLIVSFVMFVQALMYTG